MPSITIASDGVERLGLVHDEARVTCPTPPRTRDLLHRPSPAGEVPQCRRRAMRRDGPKPSCPARRQEVTLPRRWRTSHVVGAEVLVQPSPGFLAVDDLRFCETAKSRVSSGEHGVVFCREPGEGLV